jgi:SAM-dependent methyltransferase
MRAAAEQALAAYPNFRAIDARAEATLLPAASVDFVTAAQAFHWFDPVAARAEFLRILKPDGWVVLVWNERGSAPSEFHEDYEAMLQRYGVNYRAIRATRGDEKSVSAFFQGSESVHRRVFTHEQLFDYAGLRGRLLSSSYAPLPGDPGHDEMLTELRTIFDRRQHSNRIRFQYETTMWYGQL